MRILGTFKPYFPQFATVTGNEPSERPVSNGSVPNSLFLAEFSEAFGKTGARLRTRPQSGPSCSRSALPRLKVGAIFLYQSCINRPGSINLN
jgi:hypothetical protein